MRSTGYDDNFSTFSADTPQIFLDIDRNKAQVLGVQGALRRDEANTVRNSDQYLQADWALSDRWQLMAGVRHSTVKFRSRDQYIATEWTNVVVFTILIPVLIFRPSGLLGTAVREKV